MKKLSNEITSSLVPVAGKLSSDRKVASDGRNREVFYGLHMVFICADAQNIAAIAAFLNSGSIKKSRSLAALRVAHVVAIADRKEEWFPLNHGKPRQSTKQLYLKTIDCKIPLCVTCCTSPQLRCIALTSALHCAIVQI